MNSESSPFSNRVRVRSCGLLVDSGSILLTRIHSPLNDKMIWIPPGGGVELGESLEECLEREFAEETGLRVKSGPLIHIDETISLPFHAVEFFFEVRKVSGKLTVGTDPELEIGDQLIDELEWHAIEDLPKINFEPQNLLPKLRNLENRFSMDVFKKTS